jgi:uroporphyrinogen III methyltransferase/synthase
LLARNRDADVLPDGLGERGYAVDVLPVYRTVQAEPDADALARVRDGRVDAITFTSSSTVTNLCDLLGAVPDPQPTVVSIGPVTSETARARAASGSTPRPTPTPSTVSWTRSWNSSRAD